MCPDPDPQTGGGLSQQLLAETWFTPDALRAIRGHIAQGRIDIAPFLTISRIHSAYL